MKWKTCIYPNASWFIFYFCDVLGAARGCGWQNLCAVINLGAYYGVAIPFAVLFAFIFHVGGMVGLSVCVCV